RGPEWNSDPCVPSCRRVKCMQRADLVHRHGGQQTPESLAVHHLVKAAASALEECSEDRLNHVIGVHTSGEMLRQLGPGEGTNAIGVPNVDRVGSILLSRSQSPQEGVIRY